jgi:tether containing UBX domain for GLUT4
MSHVVVFNSYAKTVKIPTTPVKYLTEVRDEACQKFGVSKDQFTLKWVKIQHYSFLYLCD